MKTRRASKPLGLVSTKFISSCRICSSLWLLLLLSACSSSAVLREASGIARDGVLATYPVHMAAFAARGVEGLAWFEPGTSLVLINDYSEGATVVVIAIDPWPVTDSSIACDQDLNISQGASEE